MARLTILPDKVSIEIPDGSFVKEYVKKSSSVMFGCERGSCGVCVCSVTSGMENLSRKSQAESLILTNLKANPNQRLTCQLQILKGEVTIEH